MTSFTSISPDEFLDSQLDSPEQKEEVIECDMVNDPRLQNLSYSGLLTLHTCPKKFQLDKLNAQATEDDLSSKLTFAFGHVVGEGIQQAMQDVPEDTIMFNLFLAYECDLLEENPKQNKSFFKALFAVQKFIAMRSQGFLSEYELYYHEDKPAVELGFRIQLPSGYKYRGYVDIVLRHKVSHKILVLELKTTSAKYISGAEYKNSSQAIGYSIVLDSLFTNLNSYEVMYLVYLTHNMDFHEPLVFPKSHMQRALWLQQLIFDVNNIKTYSQAEIFPMHGESCNNFFRECKYFTICELPTEYIVKPLTTAHLETINKESYAVEVTLEQLIQAQIERGEN